MSHSAPSPSPLNFKLSNDREVDRHRPVRNEWLAADQFERWWQVAAVSILVALFAASAVLIILGLTR
jgi:4-hydroxybenzoate polyprenyltransferase